MIRKLPNGRWVDEEGTYVPPPLNEQLQGVIDLYEKAFPPQMDNGTMYLFAKVLKDLIARVEKLENAKLDSPPKEA